MTSSELLHWQVRLVHLLARLRSAFRFDGAGSITMQTDVDLPSLARPVHRFYSSAQGNPAEHGQHPDSTDRIYITHVRFSQGSNKVVLTWQVFSVPGHLIDDLKKLPEEERDGLLDVMADGLEEPFWDALTAGWETVDLGDFEALADLINTLQGQLKELLLGDPAKFGGAVLGLTDLSLIEAVATRVPIPGLDRSLGDLKHYAEIAGIVLVILTGGHILACASFKLWVHDKIGQYLTKLLDQFFRGLTAKPAEPPLRADAGGNHRPPSDDPPHRPPPAGSSSRGPDGPSGPDPSSPGAGAPRGTSAGLSDQRSSPAGVQRSSPEDARAAAGQARTTDSRQPSGPNPAPATPGSKVITDDSGPPRSPAGGARPGHVRRRARRGTASRGGADSQPSAQPTQPASRHPDPADGQPVRPAVPSHGRAWVSTPYLSPDEDAVPLTRPDPYDPEPISTGPPVSGPPTVERDIPGIGRPAPGTRGGGGGGMAR